MQMPEAVCVKMKRGRRRKGKKRPKKRKSFFLMKVD